MSTTSSNKKAKGSKSKQQEDKNIQVESNHLFAPLPECQDSNEFKIQDGFEEENPMAHAMSIMLQYQTFRSWTNYSEDGITSPRTESKDSKPQATALKKRKKNISKRPTKEKKRAKDKDNSKRNCKRIKSDIAAQEKSSSAATSERNNIWQETLLEEEQSEEVSPLDFPASADEYVADISAAYYLQNVSSSREEFNRSNYPFMHNNNTNEMDDYFSPALQYQRQQIFPENRSQQQLQLLAWNLENSRHALLLETQLQTVNQLHQIQKESWNRYILKMINSPNNSRNNNYL